MKKKAQINEIFNFVPILVAVGIVLVVGFLILGQIKNQIVASDSGSWCRGGFTYNLTIEACKNNTGSDTATPGSSYAFNSTIVTQSSMATIPGWLPIIIVAVIGSVLLLLVRKFRE